jgi:hypothetical protein
VGGGLGLWSQKGGCEGVDYELGDLRVVGNKIAFSRKGNRKMNLGSYLIQCFICTPFFYGLS